ncbi:MAG: glycosyltransferase, partial [Chloroflexi bacterium]
MSVAQRSRRQAEHKSQAAIEVSIVMPCLNEAETLATCIRKAQAAIEKNDLVAEIIVADNGSTDRSQLIAKELGVRVVVVER